MPEYSDVDLRHMAEEYVSTVAEAVSNINVPEGIVEASRALAYCKGVIVTTGMGKAGHAAKKVASSLCSLGLPACYLHPGEASHGDSGIISRTSGDVVLAFSTSGKTREVIETIQLARHLGANRVVAITSHPDGEIREYSDIILDMGEIVEAGHLNLAPTTSILIMLMIADMLSVMAAAISGFTKEDFSLRHHGGYLGKKSRGEI